MTVAVDVTVAAQEAVAVAALYFKNPVLKMLYIFYFSCFYVDDNRIFMGNQLGYIISYNIKGKFFIIDGYDGD